MFRTYENSLKFAKISCSSAKVKVLNKIDLQEIFQNRT
jgi:hypothetical protein